MIWSAFQTSFDVEFVCFNNAIKCARNCLRYPYARQEKKLPQSKKDYKPNIAGIQHMFMENASQVKRVISNYQLYGYQSINYDLEETKTYLDGDKIIANMLKEIILCDYNKQDYILSKPKRPDYLGVLNKNLSE
jgi:hypothetical protein